MAKKKSTARRVPRSAEPRMFGDGKPSQVTRQRTEEADETRSRPAAARSSAAGRSVAAPRGPANLREEYRYVLSDLRRLGILAAATFAALLVLGFIIR